MKTYKNVPLSLIAVLLLSASAFAGEKPMQFLKAKNEKLNPLLANTEKNKKKILDVVQNMMDFDTLCRDSLGKHWEGRTEAERTEFSDTLHALIEKNLIKRLKDSRNHKVVYDAETVNGDSASVTTTVVSGDGPRAEQVEIEYKMKKQGKKWGVVDMVTDGVSLVSNYRSQFNKIITEEGFDALLKKMKDKLAEKEDPKAATDS
jgi:phospholipid transport system substrate-binding protein